MKLEKKIVSSSLSISSKRVGFSILFIGFFLFSCAEKIADFPKPEKLIPKAKMVEILTELVEIESAAQIKYPIFADFNTVIAQSGDSLLKAKNVSAEDFENSMDYYGSKQQEMIVIYDEVKAKLNKEMEQIRQEL